MVNNSLSVGFEPSLEPGYSQSKSKKNIFTMNE